MIFLAQGELDIVSSVAVPLIVALLGGGLANAIVGVIRVRMDAKKEEKQGPAERDNVVATGAEKAVISLQKALEVAEREVTELRQQVDELEKRDVDRRKRIAELEKSEERRRRREDVLEEEVTELRRQMEEMRRIIDRRSEPR